MAGLTVGNPRSLEVEGILEVSERLGLCLRVRRLAGHQFLQFLRQKAADACSALGRDRSGAVQEAFVDRQGDVLFREPPMLCK